MSRMTKMQERIALKQKQRRKEELRRKEEKEMAKKKADKRVNLQRR